MLLLINNSTDGNRLSFIIQVRHTLQRLKIPFIETKRVDRNIVSKYKSKIKGIILSGSPMMLQDEDISSYNFDIFYMLTLNVPVLGICFGSQLMTIINGGKLKPLHKFVCNVVPTTIESNSFLFNGVEYNDKNKINMKFCFSNLPVKPRGSGIVLASILLDGKRAPIAFKYSDKMFCILGHPEIEHGTHIVYNNFYNYCKSWKG